MSIDWRINVLSGEDDFANEFFKIHEQLDLQSSAIGSRDLYIMPATHANVVKIKCIAKDSHMLLKKHQYDVICNTFLSKHHLTLIKVHHDFKIKRVVSLNFSLFDDYLFHLCSLMNRCLSSNISQVHQHLSQRTAASNKIVSYSHVKLIFSDLMLNVSQIIEMLQGHHHNGESKEKTYFHVFKLIRESLLLLCKIYGGRAFLSNGVLEMALLFDCLRFVFYK